MNRIDALKELLAKVEAGSVKTVDFIAIASVALPDCHSSALRAYNGYWDPAISLAEDKLPWWDWSIFSDGSAVLNNSGLGEFNGYSGIGPRALLIAILKALIAQADQ